MCREFFWNQNKFLGGTWLFLNIFGSRAQEFLTSDDLFAAPLTKLRFASPEHNLIIFFRSILNFFINFEMWKKLYFFTQNYCRSCQKCILRVQMTIWWKTGFLLESVMVFLSLRVFKQKLCGIFGRKFPVRHSELHFTCTEDHLGWKDTFHEKNYCFYHLGLRQENNLTVADLFSALLTKRQYPSPEHYFEHLFEHF